MRREFELGLDGYFRQFEPTLELVSQLINQRSHAQEIVILVCSRIDALACASVREDKARGAAFTNFVASYGGSKGLLKRVSMGDLYYELDYHLWLLPGMLERAGRFNVFSRVNEPIMKLYVESGVPLAKEEIEHVLKRLKRALLRNFRVAPGQRGDKRELADEREINRAVRAEFCRCRDPLVRRSIVGALQALVRSKALAQILYEKYRCGAIHGGNVQLDEEKFYSGAEPYFTPLWSDFYGPFQFVELPAHFLLDLLKSCLQKYKRHLLGVGKVPPDVHFQMFRDDPLSNLDLLQIELLPRVRTAVPK